MAQEFSFFANTFIALFVVIDPFAVVPVYLTLSERFPKPERAIIRRKATLTALAILFVFAATGLSVFKFFGITLPAFQIAGGILLLLMGISQLNQKRERLQDDEVEEASHDDITIFPLAMPLLAGPGAISTVVLFSSKAHSAMRISTLFAAIALVFLATYLMLKAGPLVLKLMGQTGLNLLTRLMGIFLTAIGVQFIINGINAAYKLM